MKKIFSVLIAVCLMFGLLPFSLAAKPFDNSPGLDQGTKTYHAPANTWIATEVVNSGGNGHITSVQLLVDDKTPTGLVRMAVYTSTPCILIQDLGYATVVNGRTTINGLNIPVSANSPYFLMFDLQSPNNVRGLKTSTSGSYVAAFPYNTASLSLLNQSSDAPQGITTGQVQYVITATFVPD